MTKPIPGHDLASRRVIITVLDGAGVGYLPDAAMYGDAGANTLKHVILKHGPLKIPHLNALGMKKLLGLCSDIGSSLNNNSYYGKMAPQSPGKDTTSGHWELAGLVLEKAFPLFPDGFPKPVIESFEQAIGRSILGNTAASGTEIIKELGVEHLETGKPIVYTSGDSVFQVAAHEDIIPRDLLYTWCQAARQILTGENAVGRVIARPFTGKPGSFIRTKGRRDYSLEPPGDTLLDMTVEAGKQVAVIGKVADIFAHRSIGLHRPGGDNSATEKDLDYLLDHQKNGLIWATFGDFDTVFGHRNDSEGFSKALERFDSFVGGMMPGLKKDDILFITADHGCDPTYPTTDHTREYVPLLAWSPSLQHAKNIETRTSFADLAASAAEWLGIDYRGAGISFLDNR